MFNGTYATCMKCVKHKKIGFKVKEILEFGILWNFQPIRTCFDKIIRKIIKQCHSLVFTAVSSAMFLFLPLPVIIKCNQKAVLCSIKNNNYKKQLIHLSTFLTINFIKFSTIFFSGGLDHIGSCFQLRKEQCHLYVALIQLAKCFPIC